MLLGYISTIFFLIVMLYLIHRLPLFRVENWGVKWSYFAFGLKVLAGIGVWLIYTYYYTDRINADIYKYFDDAQYILLQTDQELLVRWKIIFGLQNGSAPYRFLEDTSFWFSQGDFFFNDNRTMTRIHLILLHLSGGLYHFHTLFFAFLAFIGSFGVFRFFRKFSTLSSPLLFFSSFLVPSVLLWTSAPLKETYLFFSLGLMFWALSILNNKASSIALFILSIINLLLLKIYILVALLPGLLFWLISYRSNNQKQLLRQFFVLSASITLLLIFFQQPFIKIITTKQQQFLDLLQSSNAKSGISIPLFSSLGEFFLSIPQALFNVYIRPLAPPSWNPFSFLTALEQLLLLVIPLFALLRFRKKPALQSFRLFLFSLFFLLSVGIIIGTTTPILGAIVRYKAPIIPFYLIVVFTFVDDKLLMNRFK